MKNNLSVLILILANIIPLIGGLFFDWSIFSIVFLYWLETSITVFFTLIKVAITQKFKAIFFVPFFMVHSGGFMAGHIFFLYMLFLTNKMETVEPFSDAINHILSAGNVSYIALGALFLSHLFSFLYNYIGKREYRKKMSIDEIMMGLYKRIAFMHIFIIVLGFIFMITESQIVLILFILFKIRLDIKAHKKEHSLV